MRAGIRPVMQRTGGGKMDRNSVKWQGPMPAIVTPFDDSGAIDEALLHENIDLLLAKGATGIVVGGCTGEFWA
ncbi:MAG: dihydrodipicolinate synthase family protein, partial [Solimonas sp.]